MRPRAGLLRRGTERYNLAVSFRRFALVTAALVAVTGVVRADDDPVVVKVGETAVRSSELARRFATLPPFQLASLAQNPGDAKRRYVDSVIVPELLYSLEAERRGLPSAPALQKRLRDALRRGLVESLRKEIETAGIPEAEIRAYYDAHQTDYHHAERLRLFRILAPDEATARKIIAEAKGPGGPARWSTLAREHSLDDATKMRAGALGFVQPDGHTDVPQLVVDPGLVAAAAKVKDGDLVPEPIREGAHFAVVWRRGTLPKLDRPYDAERPSITQMLLRTRVDSAMTELLAKLRKDLVHELHPELLDSLPIQKEPEPPMDRRPNTLHLSNPPPVGSDHAPH